MSTDTTPWFMFTQAVADAPPPLGPPELNGDAFIVNSATHKYVQPRQGSDLHNFLAWENARVVSGQQVTLDCGLAIAADAWVAAELRSIRAADEPEVANGLGDRISAVLRRLGVNKSCAGCDGRRTFLNRLWP